MAATDVSEFERHLEEIELLLTGGLELNADRLVDRVGELNALLRTRARNGELSEEIVKRARGAAARAPQRPQRCECASSMRARACW